MEKEAITRRTDEIFEILDMNDYRDVKVDKLSTGMKQKVSIARTMVHDPQVLILDEPTLGLDVITSRSIIDFVKSSKQRSKIVLFSTHVMHEAEKLCDDIAIIHKGKILEIATFAEYRQKTKLDSLDDIFVKIVGE
jgi:sodium transport system ATP-binding protein